MNTITKTQRYLPHELSTKYNACKLYATDQYKISFITRRYKISKSSLMRWMKRFDAPNKYAKIICFPKPIDFVINAIIIKTIMFFFILHPKLLNSSFLSPLPTLSHIPNPVILYIHAKAS